MENGKITESYKLLGHRQVRDTLCPGDTLFTEITKWPHFSATPNVKKYIGKSKK